MLMGYLNKENENENGVRKNSFFHENVGTEIAYSEISSNSFFCALWAVLIFRYFLHRFLGKNSPKSAPNFD